MAILRHSRIALTMEIYTQVPGKTTRDTLRRLSDWLGQGDDEPGLARAAPARTRRTARAVSPARQTAASRAPLLHFAAGRHNQGQIPYSESAFGVGALEGLEPPTL